MAETFFSGFKRLFGEVVQAKRFERMVAELQLKVWVYNVLLGLAVAPPTRGLDKWGCKVYKMFGRA